MTSKGVLLLGGGGHCRSMVAVLEMAGIPIAGVVHGADCAFEAVLSHPALGRDDDLPDLRVRYDAALVTVGHIKTSHIRERLYARARELNFHLPSVVSPLAYVSRHAEIGKGTVVAHHALINAGAYTGANCIINSKALVEHDCVLGDHCHIAVGAVLCGGVHVGTGSFVGAGAVIREGITIGAHAVVGMGAVVLRPVADGELYVS